MGQNRREAKEGNSYDEGCLFVYRPAMEIMHRTEEDIKKEPEELRAENKRLSDELREARHELGIRVKVRTAEIAKANEDLHRDIAERKRIETELRETKERFEYILGATKTNVDVIDSAFNLRYVDPAWEKIYGACAGRKCYEYFMGRSESCPTCGIPVALKTHNITVTKEVLPRENNRVIEVHTIPFQGQSGEWLAAEFNIDITERIKTEAALKQNESFLSNIFSSIQDGISILDKDMNIMRVNSIMEEWYAHNMPLVGKKCYQAYHCRKAPCEVCPTKRTLESGEAAYEAVPKTGPEGKTIGWLDLYSFPFIDQKTGQMEGVIEYVRDITERKQARDNLERLNKEILESNKKLEQLALKDSYTGLYNHRYLEEIIEVEFDRARRYNNPFSVIMLDIDYFKSINDVYGHQFGDLVLKQLAEQLKKCLRRYDVVIRYGGEEFMALFPLTDRPMALFLAQRLLESINLHNFGNRKHAVKLKLSIAVASYPEDRIIKGMDLVELADQTLDRAKESGGNRVYSSLDKKNKKHKSFVKNERESNGVKFLREKIEKLNKRANQSLIEAIFAFTKTIELKDKHTGRHVEMTVKYATEVAKKMGLSSEEIENIREASILHDLGKIGISEKILLKRSKLTKEEFEEIKKHPQIGVDIIRPLHFLHDIIPLILYHHEKWDGNGYPHGLKGEDIPIGARIIAVADVYQALTSNRPYRKAYSKEKAIKIIKTESETHFDPAVVNTFLEVLRKNK